jgi:hypothetical protein
MVAFVNVWRVGAALVFAAALSMTSTVSAQTVRGQVEAGALVFDALPPQPLEPGKCGMFLWARAEQPIFFMFVPNEPAPVSAKVRVAGRDKLLPRQRFGGELSSGHFSFQVFQENDVQIEVDVAFDLDRPLQHGTMLKDGVVRVADDKGWSTIVPVVGLVGCQN